MARTALYSVAGTDRGDPSRSLCRRLRGGDAGDPRIRRRVAAGAGSRAAAKPHARPRGRQADKPAGSREGAGSPPRPAYRRARQTPSGIRRRPSRGTNARLIVEVLKAMASGIGAPGRYPQGAAARQGRVDGLHLDPPCAGPTRSAQRRSSRSATARPGAHVGA